MTITPKASWSPDAVDESEIKRLIAASMMALAASRTPRRLGGEATREELSLDKTVSRIVGNAYLGLLHLYGAGTGDWQKLRENATRNEEARSAGAQVQWQPWLDDQIIWLEQAIRRVAACALKTNNIEWGNKAVYRLERERDLLARARRKYAQDG